MLPPQRKHGDPKVAQAERAMLGWRSQSTGPLHVTQRPSSWFFLLCLNTPC